MQDKQVYELTKQDFDSYPVWFFPMDEYVENELTVRPCLNSADENFQIVVAADFFAHDGKIYFGYVYYDLSTGGVEHTKPVVFFGESLLTFWNGIVKPSWLNYSKAFREIGETFPIKFCSREILGLSRIEGVLEGLYYYDENYQINCEKYI